MWSRRATSWVLSVGLTGLGVAAPAAPAAAASCTLNQVAGAPGPAEFDTGAGLQTLLDTNCTSVGDTVTVNFLPGTLPVSLSVLGPNVNLVGHDTTLTGSGVSRVLTVVGGTATLTDLTLTNGRGNDGGAILAQEANLTLARVRITNSTSTSDYDWGGGAISMRGGGGARPLLQVSDSQFSGNLADTGGAIALHKADAQIVNSSMTANSARYSGGAIWSHQNALTITGSTLSSNLATTIGGALDVTGVATLTNTTIAGNTAGTSGGAIAFDNYTSQLFLTSSTISGNSAPGRPGLYLGLDRRTDRVATGSAIFDTCTRTLSGDFSALDATCNDGSGSNFTPPDFGLGPLADNGGPTQTMLPQPGSPLIGAIPAGTPAIPATDQRGAVRGAPYWIGAAQIGDARTPTLDAPSSTVDGFTLNVTNYDPAWTWTATASSPGTVTAGTPSGSVLPLSVTGLPPGQASTVTVTTSRTGHAGAAAAQTGTALTGPALVPTFSTPVPTTDGFTVNVTNYDPAWAWSPAVTSPTGASVSTGTPTAGALPLQVTGLGFGQPATLTVATSRPGYAPGSAAVNSAAGPDPLRPLPGNSQQAVTNGLWVTVDGVAVPATVSINPTTGVATITGAGFTITLTPRTPGGQPILPSGQQWALTPGALVGIVATGLQPGSRVLVHLFSDPITLTTGVAGATGAWAGTAVVPNVTGTHVIQVNAMTSTGTAGSASLRAVVTTQLRARASGTSKLRVRVSPRCTDQYRLRIQQRRTSTVQRGSDDPVVTTTYRLLPKAYRTTGKGNSLTVNLPKGTYRALVTGACDLAGARSNWRTLRR